MSTVAPVTAVSAAPRWAQSMRRVNQWLMFDLGFGPRPLKAAWVINFQKAACFPFFALLMWYYADKTPWATSTAAWTYLALHGSYGLVWLLKDWCSRIPTGSTAAPGAARRTSPPGLPRTGRSAGC